MQRESKARIPSKPDGWSFWMVEKFGNRFMI